MRIKCDRKAFRRAWRRSPIACTQDLGGKNGKNGRLKKKKKKTEKTRPPQLLWNDPLQRLPPYPGDGHAAHGYPTSPGKAGTRQGGFHSAVSLGVGIAFWRCCVSGIAPFTHGDGREPSLVGVNNLICSSWRRADFEFGIIFRASLRALWESRPRTRSSLRELLDGVALPSYHGSRWGSRPTSLSVFDPYHRVSTLRRYRTWFLFFVETAVQK